jgi:chloramphenicol 3-O-phosphotransferase
LTRKEQHRGDRPHGLSASQTHVFSHGDNDIQVDTTTSSTTNCTHNIATRLTDILSPKAFDRLRQVRA